MSTTDAQVSEVVARELRAGLARRRMTHAELARAGQLPESTVNRALRGDTHMSLDQFVRMTAALGDDLAADRLALVRALVGEVRRRSLTDGKAVS
jgi:plasmid maintenance system antidote protein VapI